MTTNEMTWNELSSKCNLKGPDAEKPDFHELSKFQPIDLSVLGYIELGRYSPLWMHAMGKIDIQNWTPIVHDSKCKYEVST